MDGTQIGVFKQANKISFTRLLQSPNGCTLEAQIRLEILGYFTNKALEGQLADQKLSRLLVTPDLSEGDSTWPVTMRLLDPASRGRALAGRLGGQLLAGRFASGGLAGGLLGTSHLPVKSPLSNLPL